MKDTFNATDNYNKTKESIGYVSRKDATQKDYDRIGFMSGLEVHQQLYTKHKLFCKCPAGIYQKPDEYDAEVIRHMRPTLSELGEYDGTALMEFKTRKEIIYSSISYQSRSAGNCYSYFATLQFKYCRRSSYHTKTIPGRKYSNRISADRNHWY
jgi:hypothetical protein